MIAHYHTFKCGLGNIWERKINKTSYRYWTLCEVADKTVGIIGISKKQIKFFALQMSHETPIKATFIQKIPIARSLLLIKKSRQSKLWLFNFFACLKLLHRTVTML